MAASITRTPYSLSSCNRGGNASADDSRSRKFTDRSTWPRFRDSFCSRGACRISYISQSTMSDERDCSSVRACRWAAHAAWNSGVRVCSKHSRPVITRRLPVAVPRRRYSRWNDRMGRPVSLTRAKRMVITSAGQRVSKYSRSSPGRTVHLKGAAVHQPVQEKMAQRLHGRDLQRG